MKNKTLLRILIFGIAILIFNACQKNHSVIGADVSASSKAKLKTNSEPLDVIYIAYPYAYHEPGDYLNSFDTLNATHTNPNMRVHLFLTSSFNGFASFYGSEGFFLDGAHMVHSSWYFQNAMMDGCSVRHPGESGVFTDTYMVNVAYVQDDYGNDITSQVQIIPNILIGQPGLPAHTTEACVGFDSTKCPGCATFKVITPKKQ